MGFLGILLGLVVAMFLLWISQKLQRTSVRNEYARHGASYLLAGDDDAALANFTESILTKPSAEAYAGRAGAYIGRGDLKAAIADATAAIDLKPSLAFAYYLRSIAYARLEDADNMLANAIRADQLGLEDPEARETVKAGLNAFVMGWLAGQRPPGLREEVRAYLDAAAREKEAKG